MAKIAELLAAGPTRSFEFFPPKNDEMERQLDKTVAELALLRPSFVSVTYGALGSTRERTREVVLRINHEQPFPCMPHLTCVGHRRADIDGLLDEYADNGIDNILALGGDPPADGSDPGGDFEHATDLIEVVRRHRGGFGVGVAAHPELHPRSPSRESDRRFLARKLEMADFGITQFFFEIEHYTRMVDELDALGCTTPVIPSVMPIISVAGVRRMAAMNGTHLPDALNERLDAIDGDGDALTELGIEVATTLAAALLERGVPGLHLYAMNRPTSIRRIYDDLGLAP